MSKVKINDVTKELSQVAQGLLVQVRQQQQSWRQQAQAVRRVENAVVERERIAHQERLLAEAAKRAAEEERLKAEQQPAEETAAQIAATLQENKEPAEEITLPAQEAETAAAQEVSEERPAAEPAAAAAPLEEAKARDTGQAPKTTARPPQAAPAAAQARPRAPRPAHAAQTRPAPAGQRQGGPRFPQGAAGRPSPQAGGAPRAGVPRPAGQGGAPQAQGARGRRGPNDIGSALTPTVEKERASNYDPKRSTYTRTFENNDRSRRNQRRRNDAPIVDDNMRAYRKPRKRHQKQQAARAIEPIKIESATIATETISVKSLSEKIGKPASEIIKRLFMLGIMATINNEIDFDTAQLVASEFDIELQLKLEQTYEDVLMTAADDQDDEKDLQERPPVVTIMGHVDHGKTSLLDAIRQTHVTDKEAGGITQHIGAYSVTQNKRAITFLDTPGHEAFTAMRARGAQATDIAILVIAADDGVMPQTVEAINHIQAAEVPMIVAINKIDRPNANIDKIKQELTEYNIVSEEWGGDAIMAPVSAKTGEGLDQLLEMILLVADVQELKANPDRLASGIIIEASLDRSRGPVATVLVKNGTLKTGDTVVAGTAYGRIRAMNNDKGTRVDQATPSQPVEVVGFSTVPNAGDLLNAVEEDRLSRQVAQERLDRQRAEAQSAGSRVSLDDLFSQIEQGNIKDLNVIVKADVQGSVEAVRASLEKISNDEVRVRAIHGGVGAITESDVMLASASNAIIVGFNVRPQPQAKDAADREQVDIRLYRVIYDAIEDIQQAIKGLLAPVFREVILGHAEVRETFKVSKVGTIAGCYVTDGKIVRNAQIRLIRDGIVVHEGSIASLKRFQDDTREVASGFECGISLQNYNDIKLGDQFEAFTQEQVAAE
jgi:translation initiation factor IF-2